VQERVVDVMKKTLGRHSSLSERMESKSVKGVRYLCLQVLGWVEQRLKYCTGKITTSGRRLVVRP
jgi:hypothetical protein